MANMIRGISDNGGVVFYGVDSTNIVAEAERIHKTSAVTSAALGRLLTAASMMGITLKSEQDSLTLRLNGRRACRHRSGGGRRRGLREGVCAEPGG